MRLFLTVSMEPMIKNQLAEQIPALKKYIKGGRWVPLDNLHITMLFLGEVEEAKLKILEHMMDQAIVEIRPFRLAVDGIGAFPSKHRPNILWAGVKGDLTELNRLYSQTVAAIKKTDLPFDAKPKYTPHITLARKIEGISKDDITLKTAEWEVNGLELYQSIFAKDGVKYQQVMKKSF